MVWKTSRAVVRSSSVWTYRIALTAVLLLVLVAGAAAVALQYWFLPAINDYREPLARTLSETIGQKVLIGHIRGSWQDYRPQLVLEDVVVVDQNGQEALRLAQVNSVVSWRGLMAGTLRFHQLRIETPSLLVRRDSEGLIWIAGIPVNPSSEGDGFAKWILAQHEIQIRDAAVTWLDEKAAQPALILKPVQVSLENAGKQHHLVVDGTPPMELASSVKFELDIRAAPAAAPETWSGHGKVSLPYADVARWQGWIPLPFQLDSAAGSLNLAFDFDRMIVTDVSADLELVQVSARLGTQLPNLGLAFLKGNLGWHHEASVTSLSARKLTLKTTDGLELAPMDLEARRISTEDAGPVRTELRFSGLSLGPIIKLSDRFPMDDGLRRRLAEMSPEGTLTSGQLAWEGAWEGTPAYILRASFLGAGVRPSGFLPGFAGVTGSIEANSLGGKLSLATRQARLDMPKVFAGPLPLDSLNAQVDWSISGGDTTFTLKNVAFANAHLAGTVSGTYRTAQKGAGRADLAGRITRGDGVEAWRYVPLVVTETREWLKTAVRGGVSTDTRFRVRGNLDEFPFPDEKNGLFEVAVKIERGTLRVAETWPEIGGIEGDLLFRGRRMELHGREAAVMGVQLQRVEATIADLTLAEPSLTMTGEAEGQTEEFLRFVEKSPLAGHMEHVLDGVRAAGKARLAVGIDLPLGRPENSRLRGDFSFMRNRFAFTPKFPALEDASGTINFSEKDIRISNASAVLFGHPVSVRSLPAQDGSLMLEATGRADVDHLGQLYKSPWLQFASGSTRWRASISLSHDKPGITVESDLGGVGIALPAPFGKAASSVVPLRVERRPTSRQQTMVSVNYGKAVSAQLLYGISETPSRVELALGGAAPSLSRDGTWITGTLDRLDIDAWRVALAKWDSGGKEPTDQALGLNLKIGETLLAGRRYGELEVSGQHQSGQWKLKLAGRDISGDVTWLNERGGNLNGRFANLVIPARVIQVAAAHDAAEQDVALPTLDIQAQNFVLEGRELGQMELLAVPEGSAWRLSKLGLTTPDSTLNVTGLWSPGVRSETHIKLKLEADDLGRLLVRLKLPEGVRGGHATLEGPLSWAGSPYRMDYPSMYGNLTLHATNGSFVKIEPGIAKLFGILSLQGIARELKHGDVFSKGYTFEAIRANVSISNGIMDTQDFQMNGAAAKVAIKGKVNLNDETQLLTVRVSPVIGESISLGTALLVNPAVGVGVLIGQKALKDPLDRLLSQEYVVKGTWSEPKIESAFRATKSPGEKPPR